MKLWEKGYELDEFVEKFTVGEDYLLDESLLPYDIIATKAHARVLKKAGIFSDDELKMVEEALDELLEEFEKGNVRIRPQDEDCHTVIENFLVSKLGKIGEKIHTGRSRNDQVLTALRLYYKDALLNIEKKIEDLIDEIEKFSKKYGKVRFAGMTHTRKAMPTDFKTWAEALKDALSDNLEFLRFVGKMIDRSPLGTGAGYGIPMELSRELAARELGFREVQKNPIYTQSSRGKYDLLIHQLLSQISLDLNRVASDLILMGFLGMVEHSKEITTGSSIMPQKRNPDVLEIVRALHHRIHSNSVMVMGVVSNMVMGYHRDYQLLKKATFESIDHVLDILEAMKIVFKETSVNKEVCESTLSDEAFATEEVYDLVKKGIPFREAYRRVAKKYGG